MATRTIVTQSIHNRLVRALVKKFESEGFYVRADDIKHPNGSPPNFSSRIPDIYAVKTNSKIIAEAETCDSISWNETYQQWLSFSNVIGAKFHIIVPKRCLQDAKIQANSWGIKVAAWWHLDI